jgi:hypothetical protein
MSAANRQLWVRGGIAGIAGTLCYILAIVVPWPGTQLGNALALLVVSAWPVLSIIYGYALYDFVAAERDGAANRLSFVFEALAFTTVLMMIIVQLAADGLPDVTQALDDASQTAFRRALNLVDLGLDVAWDMLIGTALIFSGVAIRRRSGLGLAWAVPSILLGVALIILNAATFPMPPGNAGLIDIGPGIGLLVILLATRLIILGRKPFAQTAHTD